MIYHGRLVMPVCRMAAAVGFVGFVSKSGISIDLIEIVDRHSR